MSTLNERVSNCIPEDVALSILSKLPLKSLKRFSCVHKRWARLFENPYFMSMFTSNSHSSYVDLCLLLMQPEPIPEVRYHCAMYLLSGESFENRFKVDLPPPPCNCRYLDISSSAVNGTFCLFYYFKDENQNALWNPVTGWFKAIPCSPATKTPSSVEILYGFGYDHAKDDYKLIQHVHFDDHYLADSVPHWELYSLRSNSWRTLDDVDDKLIRRDHYRKSYHAYTSGVCHWLSKIRTSELVSFDLCNEVFFITPIPLDVSLDVQLAVFNGCVAITSFDKETLTFHISVLGEPGVRESWTKLFVLGPLTSVVDRSVGIGKKGNILFTMHDGILVWFDLSTQMFKKKEEINVLRLPWYKPIHMEIWASSVEE